MELLDALDYEDFYEVDKKCNKAKFCYGLE